MMQNIDNQCFKKFIIYNSSFIIFLKMFEINQSVDKILKEGIPFRVEFDPLSVSYLGLALFLALFAALTMWSLAQKSM